MRNVIPLLSWGDSTDNISIPFLSGIIYSDADALFITGQDQSIGQNLHQKVVILAKYY